MLTIFKSKTNKVENVEQTDNVIEVVARDVIPKKPRKDDSTIPFMVMIIGTMGVIGGMGGARIAELRAKQLPLTSYNILQTYKCIPGQYKEQYLNELADEACLKHSKIVNMETAQRYAIAEANAYKKMVTEQKRVYLADVDVTKAQAVFDLNNGASLRQGVDVTFNEHLSNITNGAIPSANAENNQLVDPNARMQDHEIKNRFDNINKGNKPPPKNLNYPFYYK